MLIFKNEALDIIFSYQSWIKEKYFLTLLVFYSSLIIGSLLILPSALFEIVNGFIFATLFDGKFYGLIIGLAIYLVFTAISFTITFKFAKFLIGKRLKELLIETTDKMKILNFIFQSQGLKAMFLIRLSPLFPCSIFNYLLSGFDSKIYHEYLFFFRRN